MNKQMLPPLQTQTGINIKILRSQWENRSWLVLHILPMNGIFLFSKIWMVYKTRTTVNWNYRLNIVNRMEIRPKHRHKRQKSNKKTIIIMLWLKNSQDMTCSWIILADGRVWKEKNFKCLSLKSSLIIKYL